MSQQLSLCHIELVELLPIYIEHYIVLMLCQILVLKKYWVLAESRTSLKSIPGASSAVPEKFFISKVIIVFQRGPYCLPRVAGGFKAPVIFQGIGVPCLPLDPPMGVRAVALPINSHRQTGLKYHSTC